MNSENIVPDWYLFLYQIPPQPQYLRVRALRQLTQLGALHVKKSAYVLPATDETLEDLQWLRKSIVAGGAEAWIFRANAVAGITDEELVRGFGALRAQDYARISGEARELLRGLDAEGADPGDNREPARIARKLRRDLDAVRKIDFFHCPEFEEANTLMNAIESRIATEPRDEPAAPKEPDFRGRRWVTRKGVKVDRITSAWLIRRFIDPAAEFVFVDPAAYKHAPTDLRFDMFEGEFTHEGDLCTFEALAARFSLTDPGVKALAEMVHDIDLKDAKYGRPETAGLASIIDGLVASQPDDAQRLAAGMTVLDALHGTRRG